MDAQHEEFRAAVRQMRNAQKKFFRSAPGTQDREDAYADSRKWERRVDKMLKPQQLCLLEEMEVGSADP